MIIEIRRTLTRPWPALLLWEESNISPGNCNIIHVFMFKRKKSDGSKYEWFGEGNCEENIKAGMSQCMNHFGGDWVGYASGVASLLITGFSCLRCTTAWSPQDPKVGAAAFGSWKKGITLLSFTFDSPVPCNSCYISGRRGRVGSLRSQKRITFT